MIVNIKKIAKESRINTPDLITRPVGRKMYKKIRKMMEFINNEEVIVLDFSDIKVIDSSFIDEMIVKLITESKNVGKSYYVKLKNISGIAEINIDSVFRSYSNYNDEKIAVVTDNICENNSFYIGQLQDTEREIIDYMRVNRSVSLQDLTGVIGLKADKISDIMDGLNSRRLIRIDGRNVYSII